MPTLSSSTRRQVLLVGGVCSLAFLALAGLFVDFVLDDAYISYRFAQHLAEGRGPTWNPSEAPVEGYTNPLWVALLAMALALGAEPVVISKLLSIAAALALIWLLAFASRRLHWSHALVLTGALGFSAPFAFLAMMGLETALAALLLALTAGAAAEVVTRPRATAILLFHAAAFFSMLARFDSGLFVAGALAGLLVVLGAMDRDPRAVRRLLLGGLPFLVLGLLYMLWRFDYYGYWLPNVFYVKVLDPAALPGPSGPKYVGTFVARVLAPYLLLALLSWRRGASKRAWRSILPILLGCLLTGAFFFVVVPFQSLLWRFLYPVTAALLVAMTLLAAASGRAAADRRRPVAALLLVIAFAAWNLRLMPLTFLYRTASASDDRVAVGRRLAGLEGVMLTRDAGALAYHSGWRAADYPGLTSAALAHEGLSFGFLEELEPDLVVVAALGAPAQSFGMSPEDQDLLEGYLRREGFEAVTAIRRNSRVHLLCFVRRDSALAEELVERLLSIEGVRYGDLPQLLARHNLPYHREAVERAAARAPVAGIDSAGGGG